MAKNNLHVTADPRGLFVLEGGPTVGTFKIANSSDSEVQVTPELSVPRGFRSEPVESQVTAPAHGQVDIGVKVWLNEPEMPRGTLTLHAGDAFDWKSIIATDDWVRTATMSASSSSERDYWLGWDPVQAQNGFTFDEWASGATWEWRDATANEYPDWLQAAWDAPKNISMVRVVMLDTASAPASEYGLRSYDVEVRSGESWQRVGRVRDNIEGTVQSTFSPVATEAVRIVIHDSNSPAYSRVLALEAYGPRGKPTPEVHKRFGGPGAIYPEML